MGTPPPPFPLQYVYLGWKRGSQIFLGLWNFAYDILWVGGDVWRQLCRGVHGKFPSCRWGAERRVLRAQSRERGPPSAWADIVHHILYFSFLLLLSARYFAHWAFMSVAQFLMNELNQRILTYQACTDLWARTTTGSSRRKITTRLRKVGTPWTPYFTVQWFCLRRAGGLSPSKYKVTENIYLHSKNMCHWEPKH
jgi:hypothetical protein